MSCISRYDESVNECQVTYLAGGAAQNAARGAAVSLGICDHKVSCIDLFWLFNTVCPSS